MKRNKWQRRLLSCFLVVVMLLGCFLGCLPLRANAVVPLGLVQSALASFVTSAGYKMWSDNGGGELMVAALSTLYQSWLDSTDPVGALTLGQMSENDYVYLDNSGQIVIRKAAADLFQQFAYWLQTEYSVPVGSETPTDVVFGSGGSISASNSSYPSGFSYSFWQPPIALTRGTVDVTVVQYGNTITRSFTGNYQYAALFRRTASSSSSPYGYVVFFISLQPFTATRSTGETYNSTSYTVDGNQFYGVFVTSGPGYTSVTGSPYNELRGMVTSIQTEPALKDFYRFVYGGTISEAGGIAGLGVTLAQAVADVVGQAKEDDAVVIGVGASAGATAQDIADLVAQGVKAQTLDPSVSITAEAVIDTPVQPYPDIDGLGLPTLGAALVSRFPFCVPWDFVDTLKILNANPIPPVFDVTLVPASVAARWGVSGNYTLHVDLTAPEYAKLFVALRWGALVGFCLGLALLTKRLIWTA